MFCNYQFKAKIWKYKGKSGWHFITLPKVLTKKIRKNHGHDEEGWGRLKTVATIGQSNWKTAIWYDSKYQSYLLPVKSEIRKREQIKDDSSVTVTLVIDKTENRFSVKQY